MRIGIIGAGASGLAAAWMLQDQNEVFLFEQQARLGGHAQTVDVEQDGQLVPIDAGFEFFTGPETYPNFHRLLRSLSIPLREFPASTTIFRDGHPGSGILLPPWRGGKLVWSALSWRTLPDLLRFRRFLLAAIRFMNAPDPNLTIAEFLDRLDLPRAFRERLVLPYLLAQFSMEPDAFNRCLARDILTYSVAARPNSVRQPMLYEVVGGSRGYINAIASRLTRVRLVMGERVCQIVKLGDQFLVDGAYSCDQLIIATNPRAAAALLEQLEDAQPIRDALAGIDYYETRIAVHGDPRLMPRNPRHWSVFNLRYDDLHSSLSVWKPWRSARPIFRSWVTFDAQLPDPLFAEVRFEHPIGNAAYYHAQKIVQQSQGLTGLWFAGSYTQGIDSHESAISSAVQIAEKIGAPNFASTERQVQHA
jgi:uncharacterized protein